MLDPERLAPRAPFAAPSNIYIGKNAGYTYPDLNNAYLGAIRASDGRVLIPSFHRPDLFNYNDANPTVPHPQAFNDPAHPNWTNVIGKYRTLRPRPEDQKLNATDTPTFPYPVDIGGDVKNVEGSLGFNGTPDGMDSIWVDHDYPVRDWNGRLYKPLFAWFIADLDGRVNLNTAGNIRYASNQGWGGWEVNPAYVLNRSGAEYQQLLASTGTVIGRYGRADALDGQFRPRSVTGASLATPGTAPRDYARVDYDSGDKSAALAAGTGFGLPASGDNRLYPAFDARYGDGNAIERTDHPSVHSSYFNPDFTPTGMPNWKNRIFSIADMRLLNWKYTGDSTVYQESDLGKLLPNNLGSNITTGLNPRFATTTVSSDFAFPGIKPFLSSFAGTERLSYTSGAIPNYPSPVSGAGYNAAPSFIANQPPIQSGDVRGYDALNGSALPTDWRSTASACSIPGYEYVGALNLNRQLTDYRIDPNAAFDAGANANLATNTAHVQRAERERQEMALEIYKRLIITTGVNYAATKAAQPNEWNAKRWMAQLAVNIVDYIDNDDVMTPFVAWTRIQPNRPSTDSVPSPADPNMLVPNEDDLTEVVWGTELPRLVLNEAYAEVRNHPDDTNPTPDPMDMKKRPTKDFLMNFWVELHNPLAPDSTAADNGAARLVNSAGQAVYRLQIIQPTLLTNPNWLTSLQNNRGNVNNDYDADDGTTPFPPHVKLEVSNWNMAPAPINPMPPPATDTNIVLPANHTYAGVDNANNGFYVVGPNFNLGPAPAGMDNQPMRCTLRKEYNEMQPPDSVVNRTAMTYPVERGNKDTNANIPAAHDVVLRRLANPYLPYQPNQTMPLYNPYITVDVMRDVRTQDGLAYDQNGERMAPIQVADRVAYGKRSPYGSAFDANPANNQIVEQDPATQRPGEPKTTFFRHNGRQDTGPTNSAGDTLDTPFEWLVHLDRQLINIFEIQHVSAFKPHQLTQEFKRTQGTPPPGLSHRHVAPWLRDPTAANTLAFAPSTRLYRALELLTTASRTEYQGNLARVPGKININTIYDREVLQALIDPQQSNSFHQSTNYSTATTNDLLPLWDRILQVRSPALVTANPNPRITAQDQPFMSFGEPYINDGTPTDHVGRTLVRTIGGNATPDLAMNNSIFEDLSQTNSYVRDEMLRKMQNNITTRSNTFAVWCTVGYFEVRGYNAQGRPCLGTEISELPRNRFFAIVDRTNLSLAVVQTPAPATPGEPRVGMNRTPGPKPCFFKIEQMEIDPATTPDNRFATVVVPVSEYQISGQPVNTPPTTVSIDQRSTTPGLVVNRVEGVYDGQEWSVSVNTPFYVMGLGNSVAGSIPADGTVIAPIQVYGPPVGAPAGAMGVAVFKVRLANEVTVPNLSPGDSFSNVPLGNPGPQKDFNVASPVYSGVVPLAVQVR
ncbi:hypothetical protein [Tuwongella immobilis]|nr:hypothetical protein [Tuwongella immobilis]